MPTKATILEQIFQNTSDGVIAYDLSRRYTLWNPVMESFTGLRADEVLGQIAEEIFPFLIETGEVECINRAFRGETIITDLQHYTVPANGKEGYFSGKYMPRFDEQGEIIGCLAIIREFTESVKLQEIEKQKISSERRFESIFANAPMGIQIYNKNGKCTYVNETWEKVFGSKVSELENYCVLEDKQLEEKGVLNLIRMAYQGKSFHIPPVFFDPAISGKKGAPRWIESYTFLIKNNQQEPEIAILTIDATEMVNNIRTKEESELKFKGIADALPVMVWVTDMQGNVEYINDRWFHYTGQPKEYSRDVWMTRVHPEDLPLVIERQREALRTKGSFTIEYRLRDRDGNYQWFLALTLTVHDENGKPFKRFGTATNIEQQKQALEAHRESVRARDEFLSIASHELRTPLTSLALQNAIRFAYLRDKEPISKDLMASWFEKDSKQLGKLNRLIDDMLDVSRLKTGKLDLQIERINIVNLIEETIDRFRPQLLEKCGGVTFNGPEKIEMSCDPFRIEQVLTNLLTNAMKYGNGKPVVITVREKDNMVEISVQDQGIGIAPQDQQRIFGRFERAIPANQVSGLGLGLAIAKDFVEAHQGTITVVSDVSRGSDFIIRLPLKA